MQRQMNLLTIILSVRQFLKQHIDSILCIRLTWSMESEWMREIIEYEINQVWSGHIKRCVLKACVWIFTVPPETGCWIQNANIERVWIRGSSNQVSTNTCILNILWKCSCWDKGFIISQKKTVCRFILMWAHDMQFCFLLSGPVV